MIFFKSYVCKFYLCNPCKLFTFSHEDEEKFVPKPYAGKSSEKSKPKKAAEKKKTEPKSAPKQEEKKPSQDGQMSLLDFGMAKAG